MSADDDARARLAAELNRTVTRLRAQVREVNALLADADRGGRQLQAFAENYNNLIRAVQEGTGRLDAVMRGFHVLAEFDPRYNDLPVSQAVDLIERIVGAYVSGMGLRSQKKTAAKYRKNSDDRRARWEQLRAEGKEKSVCDRDVAARYKVTPERIRNIRSHDRTHGDPWRGDEKK
ncbi:hypothetical protein [Paraburkholderia sp. BR13444]|uniref:hypothetical protein n=1 Tax=Paraburkholderia sp. BR13444 TaxID=3236997 RepID=UPI0034CE377E